MHCISKYIIDWCVTHGIDTIIVGHNDNWKQENLGMQNFTYIPYELFFHMLNYKSENVEIRYIENEEAYTSGTSFLDGEEPCKNNYNKERRIYRGLFISNKGVEINADVNGAYQIMKKVFPDVKFTNGIEDVGLHPTIIKYLGSVNGKILPIDFVFYFHKKTIWLYSGYTFEECLIKNKVCEENIFRALRHKIIKNIDVMVDGRYIDSERDISLHWRGSKNQRVINVQESLKKKRIILYST